jgi:hypothetical protein
MAHTVTHASMGNATSAPALAAYPSNRIGWLHALNRALARAEAAREIGLEAMLLVLAIAMEEDSRQYRVPATFFFLELQRMLGIRSRARLEQARQKAIDAGWLIFLPGPLGDLAAARYWTVIPDRLNLSEGLPQDASLAAEEIGFRRGDAACLNELQQERATLPGASEVQTPSFQQISDEPQISPVANADSSRSVTATRTHNVPEKELSVPVPPNLAEPQTTSPEETQEARGSVSKFRNYNSIAMNPVTRAQALALYAAYPQPANSDNDTTDATCDMQAIHRALAKSTFAQLIPIVKRFAILQHRPGEDPNLTPPLVTWFDEERWRDA